MTTAPGSKPETVPSVHQPPAQTGRWLNSGGYKRSHPISLLKRIETVGIHGHIKIILGNPGPRIYTGTPGPGTGVTPLPAHVKRWVASNSIMTPQYLMPGVCDLDQELQDSSVSSTVDTVHHQYTPCPPAGPPLCPLDTGQIHGGCHQYQYRLSQPISENLNSLLWPFNMHSSCNPCTHR